MIVVVGMGLRGFLYLDGVINIDFRVEGLKKRQFEKITERITFGWRCYKFGNCSMFEANLKPSQSYGFANLARIYIEKRKQFVFERSILGGKTIPKKAR